MTISNVSYYVSDLIPRDLGGIEIVATFPGSVANSMIAAINPANEELFLFVTKEPVKLTDEQFLGEAQKYLDTDASLMDILTRLRADVLKGFTQPLKEVGSIQ